MEEMKEKKEYSDNWFKKNLKIMIPVFMIVLILVFLLFWLNPFKSDVLPTPTAEVVVTPAPTPEATMMPEMADLYAQNPDIVGWLTIEGTVVDYPLMFTPADEEKYLRKNFQGAYSGDGLPFLDKDCSMNPESDNLIFYGHNRSNGNIFKTIMNYKDESFWKKHPVIKVKTLYEEREYEVLAAFYDRVYYKSENCFKFYQFIDATEESFKEAMDYYKTHSEYDTGVEAEFGDKLISLVTCSYHHEHGRFVVVARAKS
ncbi:MAG: sortase [Ruminococcaceae bacterium]|nr:sortase [Oscillospiraceae bacterium]